MIDGRNFFDQPVKNDLRTYDKLKKWKNDKLRRRLHNWLSKDYPYFKEHYNMIATDWSKQQALDADPKAI